MKLVEKIVVRRGYYKNNSLEDEVIYVASEQVLFESNDLLRIGAYVNNELRLCLDCDNLFKIQNRLESESECIINSHQTSDSTNLRGNKNREWYNLYLEKYIVK